MESSKFFLLSALLLSACPPPPQGTTLAVANRSGVATTVYVAFGADSSVVAVDWSDFCDGEVLNCSFSLAKGETQELPLAGRYVNATFSFFQPVTCNTTKAEVNLNNPNWYDISDVSLVDGFNVPVQVQFGVQTLSVLRPTGNEAAFGVYPLGCDICVARQQPSCGYAPGSEGCKAGTQYNPAVPCQAQGSVKGGGNNRVMVELIDIEPA